MGSLRRGYLYGTAAYGLWGFLPLCIALLHPAGSEEILAHRIVWSVVFLALVLLLAHRRVGLPRARQLLGVAAAALISVNWGAFVNGVTRDRVVEVSLGYFIGPVVTVLLGVLAFGEPMPPVRLAGFALVWTALAIFTADLLRDARRRPAPVQVGG